MLFCSPVTFGKSHLSTPLNSKRLQNGIENTGLGVNYPTMGLIRVELSLPVDDIILLHSLQGDTD